jgi:putative transport protein
MVVMKNSMQTVHTVERNLKAGRRNKVLQPILQTTGLVLFIASVGFSAGPGFVARLKKNGVAYIILCLTTAVFGAGICVAVIKLLGVEAPLAVGMMTGAFTTSPGFAAAKEAVSETASSAAMVAAGYGIIYPIGVICKVLFIQIVPKLLHANMAHERELIALPEIQKDARQTKPLFQMDGLGLFPFSLAVVLGILLGSISIPLPGGTSFALGTTVAP